MSMFSTDLAFGQIAESQIALWLRRARGYSILPVYEKELHTGKGPRFFTPTNELVAPDMIAMRGDGALRWIEAKRKTVFSWYRVGGYWVTGIDLNHYRDYLRIARTYPFEVWLLFLHEENRDATRPRDPWPCPTGLFGSRITYLYTCESHTCPPYDPHTGKGHGRHGMVYWAWSRLQHIATLEEVRAVGVPTFVEEAA